MKNLKKLALTGIAAATLAGCFGDSPDYVPISREELSREVVPATEYGRSIPLNRYIFDRNNDGKADVISYAATISCWIAEDIKCEQINCKDVKVMTPEIREVATRVMNESRELSYLLNEENLRLMSEKEAKK